MEKILKIKKSDYNGLSRKVFCPKVDKVKFRTL